MPSAKTPGFHRSLPPQFDRVGGHARRYLDAEMIRMIQIAIKGIEITDEKLAMDVIHEVGHSGAYITHEHSLRSMRSQSQTKLFDRRSRDDWLERTKGKELRDRAYETAAEILVNHQPFALPDGAAKAMGDIVYEFEKEIEKGGK